jgi:long-chain acyl-CoA synthetase
MDKIPYKSIPDMLRQNAIRFDGKQALKYRRQQYFITLSYAEFYNRALMAARGLIKCHVKPGDRVAILSENRAGWVIADMGILCAGCVTVPIYPTNTPEQIAYSLKHSGARIVFVSTRSQYAKLVSIRQAIPDVELVISFERFLGDAALPLCTFYQLSEIDLPITVAERSEIEWGIDRITRDDLVTLIYTSGTTGIPKGVMLTHGNILYNAFHIIEIAEVITENEVLLSFLPLSHILERTAGYYTTIMGGSLMAIADSVEKVSENMLEIKPTAMVGVPRLFEKIHSSIFEKVHQMSAVKRGLFHWALKVGQRYVELKYIKKRHPGWVAVKYRLADILIFSKIRERFGGRMHFFCSGGAPLDKSINEFFWVIGIPILEGYGLTETSPAVCFNSPSSVRFGAVGLPLPETSFRVEADGELSVKGPQVMKGYYNNPEGTKECLVDGWFKTGDIGHIDDDGFIFITDRKKEMIITAGGKNIPPQPIENELKLDKYISQAFVYGDRKPYLVALITPNMERLFEFAREHQIEFFDLEDLVINDRVVKLFSERISEVNSRIARYESIKRFVVLAHDFSIDGGELTPTLKLRRKVICGKYQEKIDGLYLENGSF